MESRFDKVWNRWGTGARKWDAVKNPASPFYSPCDEDEIVPMWVADMDFATADSVIDALKERLEHPILGYAEISDRFIKHPSEALSVNDKVKVRVLSVDIKKKRISLSMKNVK